jgi:hypothetical protein
MGVLLKLSLLEKRRPSGEDEKIVEVRIDLLLLRFQESYLVLYAHSKVSFFQQSNV